MHELNDRQLLEAIFQHVRRIDSRLERAEDTLAVLAAADDEEIEVLREIAQAVSEEYVKPLNGISAHGDLVA